jgi:ABC-2 type transport system permease protein/oleandomycin transport system permease protein
VTGLAYAVSDTLLMTWRNLLRIPRQPDLLIGFTVQPVMFLLLFSYVFGGAIATPGFSDYTDFLVPGIIAQSMTFGGFVTALGLTDDLRKGLIDRFRSLPMARSAVLAGRTLADVATNAFQLFLMLGVGLLIGFDFNSTAPKIIGGILLMLLFGYAFSWVFALLGLYAGSPESANAIGFTVIFPVTFLSAAFAPPESMPDGLQWVAENNPFTTIVDALRHLWLGTPAGNDVWGAVAWSVGLIAVFSFLGVRGYRKAVAK